MPGTPYGTYSTASASPGKSAMRPKVIPPGRMVAGIKRTVGKGPVKTQTAYKKPTLRPVKPMMGGNLQKPPAGAKTSRMYVGNGMYADVDAQGRRYNVSKTK
jgi:hypothetical protein